jgi:hypothetical protein
MPISSVHPEYSEKIRRVKFVRDMCSDEMTVKDKGERYLPAAFAKEEPERYEAYLKRAYFFGVTNKTLRDMVGAAFRKPASYDLPDALMPLVGNFDGAGNGIERVNKSGVNNLLQAGRHCILVDYPSVEDGMTAEQEARLNLMPYAAEYTAEALDNWSHELIFGREMLTMVKLVEYAKVPIDEFSHELKKTYRVLRLRSPEEASVIFGGAFGDYVYTQALYDEAGKALTEEYIPKKASSAARGVGIPFNYIPFFVADLDQIPLMDIAVVNRAHYQVTANYMENLEVHGQLTLGVVSSMTNEQFQTANPDGIKVGAMKGHFLGENGDFKTATAPESSSLDKALNDLQKQMESMGAKLMTEGGEKTAEEARINASSQTSALDMVVSLWDSVVNAALKACAEYKAVDPDLVSYTMNRDYYDTALSAQEAGAIITWQDAQNIARSDALYMLRTGRIKLDPNRTDEDIAADIESESI